MADQLEIFLEGDRLLMLARCDSSMRPERGEGINIVGVWYVVTKRSYAVDYAGTSNELACCNIMVRPMTEEEKTDG